MVGLTRAPQTGLTVSTGMTATPLQSDYADWLTWPDVFKAALHWAPPMASGQGWKALIGSANSDICVSRGRNVV
jgi:hypothetical protein